MRIALNEGDPRVLQSPEWPIRGRGGEDMKPCRITDIMVQFEKQVVYQLRISI